MPNVKIRVTEPCKIVLAEGDEAQHAAFGDECDVTIETALEVVGSGRAVPLTEMPSRLKGASGPAKRL